jgi:hypothetical protein
LYYEILGFIWIVFMLFAVNRFKRTELDFDIDYRKGRSYENWK